MTVAMWIDLDRGEPELNVDARVNPGDVSPFIVVDIGIDVSIVGKDASKFRALAEALLRVADEFEAQKQQETARGES